MFIIKLRKNKVFLFSAVIFVVLLVISFYFFIKAYTTKDSGIYSENSTIEYNVCLLENNYYKDTCLTEDQEYLRALTDEVRATFNYNRFYGNDTKTNIEYRTVAKLIIYNRENNRELYTYEEEITKPKAFKGEKVVHNIQDVVTFKLQNYNDIVNRYVLDYSINAKADVVVSLRIKEGDSEKDVASLTVPLLEQTYSISRNTINNSVDESITINFKNYLFISILLIILDLIFIGITIFRFYKDKKESEFEREIKRLLDDYDRIIVETKSNSIIYEGKELTELDSFMELVDVRDTIEKPILYIKQNEQIRDFIVQDHNQLYRFRMDSNNYKGGEVK